MSETDTFYDFESEYYDYLYGAFDGDVMFYKETGIAPPVLEIFAGTGRIVSRFSGGVGLEINQSMLRRSRNSFVKVMGDARTLPFKRRFNSIVIGLNSLLLLPNDGKRLVLKEARRVANPNSLLFIDVINGFSLKRKLYRISDYNDQELEISLKMVPKRDSEKYILSYRYNIIAPLRKKVEKNITIYPITDKELREMLASENFEVHKTYGDYDLSPLCDLSEKLIVIARAI